MKQLCWVPKHASHLPGGWSWDPYPTCGVHHCLFLWRAKWRLSCSHPASLRREQHFPDLAGVRLWPAGKRQWSFLWDPRYARGGWRRDCGPHPCWQFSPLSLQDLRPSQLCQQQRPHRCFHTSGNARSGISAHKVIISRLGSRRRNSWRVSTCSFLVVERRDYASCQLVLSLPSGTADDATALKISQQLPLKASRSCMEGKLTLWTPLWETSLPSYTGVLISLPPHLLLSKPRMEVYIHSLLQWDTQWGPSRLLLDFRAASSHR